MLCLPSPAVGAVQFPLVPDGGAAGDLHLHLHQDAVPCHPREEDRVSAEEKGNAKGIYWDNAKGRWKKASFLPPVAWMEFRGFFWKAARIGERLSPWVAFGCFAMGISIIIF
ncbi:unnamed protein product [Musa banksii]